MRILSGFVSLLLVGLLTLEAIAEGALSPEKRKELQFIASDFRKTKVLRERLDLIAKADKIDDSGVETLFGIVTKDLQKEMAGYRQMFGKGAVAVVGSRVLAGSLPEISELRARIMEVRKQEGLTKETIVAISDPALARLKALILVKPEQVLEKFPELEKKRDTLLVLGEQWEACLKALIDEDAKIPPPSFSAYLQSEEEIGAWLALPMDDEVRRVLAANAALANKIDPEEARCILELNLVRNLVGLPPVATDLSLLACARDHSTDMLKHNFFAHESPLPGKKTPYDRAKMFGTTGSGENIAMGYRDGTSVNMGWWHSPGHHKNMLADHTRVGVGRNGRHWTELFGR